jgi:hypothetical protein
MRRHASTSLALLALATAACTKVNPNYCADAGKANDYACSALRDAATEMSPADAVGDADAATDRHEAGEVAAEVMPEVTPPICTTDDQCPSDAGTPACETSDAGAMCVECTAPKHCTVATKPACDMTAHRCVECVGTGTECTFDATKTVCNAAAQTCVQCLDNTKCSGTKPICDAAQKSCRGCTADSDCKGIGPSICVDYDGHCAAAGEVITLQGGASCVAAGSTYCKASSAVAALSSTQPILLVVGSDPVGAIDPPVGSANQVLIVGQNGAVVGAGSGDPAGVHASGAVKYWIRDLTISGGTVGIFADQATEVHITRCIVTSNGKGGIKTVGSGFDITNTIVAVNGPGTDTGGVVWGGVRLGDIPVSAIARFDNNTVVDNMQIGISCKDSYDTSTSLVHGNLGGETINCTGALCCGASDPDPKLDATYHLMSGSPCIGQIAATAMSVTVDIDLQARPTPPNGKLDCGADQYVP